MEDTGAPERCRLMVVEDNPADVELIRVAVESVGFPLDLEVVDDGQKALTILNRSGGSEKDPSIDLLMLDLNLPRMNGKEVLRRVRQNQAVPRMPIFVLSASDDREEIAQCYEIGATAYMTKPVDLNEFDRLVRDLFAFWWGHVVLPSRL